MNKNSKIILGIAVLLSSIIILYVIAGLWGDIPLIEFVSPTPSNGTSTSNLSFQINASLNSSNLADLTYLWNNTNYTIFNSSLVVMFNFDNISTLGENSNLALDISNSLENATIQGAPIIAGKYGNAVSFNGLSVRNVSIADSASFDNPSYTIMAWINRAGNGDMANTGSGGIATADPITSKCRAESDSNDAVDVAFYFGVNQSNSVLVADFENDSLAQNVPIGGSTSLNNNQWYHVAYVVKGNSYSSLYVNGVLDANRSIAGYVPELESSCLVGIGRTYGSTDIFATTNDGLFNGSIDEFKIWNYAMSVSEIKQQFMAGLQKTSTEMWGLLINQTNYTIGTYNYQVFAQNSSGSLNSTDLRTIIITSPPDLIFPNVTLNAPINNTNLSNLAVTFNCTSYDDVNLKNVTLYFNSSGVETIALVQHKNYSQVGAQSPAPLTISCNLTSPATAGHLLVTAVGSDKNAGTYTAPSGFTIIHNTSATSVSGGMAYKIATGGEQNITWTWTTQQESSCWAGEFSGIDTSSPLDVFAFNTTFSSADTTTGKISTGTTGTTSQANELAVAMYAIDTIANTDNGNDWTNGFTNLGLPVPVGDGGAGAVGTAYKILSSTGTVETIANWSVYAGNLVDQAYAVVAVFKASSKGYSWHANETKTITGIKNETIFTKTLTDSLDYNWNCYVCDSNNQCNWSSSNYTFNISTPAPPVITIISPLNQSYSSANIDFNVSLNENGSWCGFSLDGSANITMTKFNDTYFNYTNSSMSLGNHNITFACNDTLGNMNSSSGTRAFSRSDNYPSVTLISPTNNTIKNTTLTNFNFTSSDDINLVNATLYFCNLTNINTEQAISATWVANRSTWYYNDSNTYPGENWFNTSFDISTWKTGSSYFCQEETGCNTDLANASQYADVTYYFKRNFTITNASKVVNMSFAIDFDDAYAVYINGHMINSSNLTTNWTSHSEVSNVNGVQHDSTKDTVPTAPIYPTIWLNSTQIGYLSDGINYIAVAIKQFSATSTDAVMELSLQGYENQTITTKSCSGTFSANTSLGITGITNSSNITLTLGDNQTYLWNVKVCDSNNQCNWSSSNYTLEINSSYVAPVYLPMWCAFHAIHTTYSDGDPTMTQDNAVTNLQNYFDCAGTLDHDSSLSQAEWSDWIARSNANNTDNNFTFFFGTEWSGSQHIYYITMNPSATQQDAGDASFNTVAELSAWLQQNNSVAQHNHPARTSGGTDFSNSANYNESLITLVEMVNQNSGTAQWHWSYSWNCSTNSGCTSYNNPHSPGASASGTGWIKYALDNGIHLGFSCGNDYHSAYPLVPKCYTGIVNPANWTRGGVIEPLKARHTWVGENKTWMSVTANNGSNNYIMGDIFSYASTTPNITLNYSINATAGNTIVNVSLFYKGIIVNLTKFSGQQNVVGSFTQNLTDGVEEYLFIEAIQSNGQRAWSSPMWVNYSEIITDSEYPIFSNYQDNNGSLVNSGTGLFNVTIASTNGTVLLEINNTNYTASNSTASLFNVSVPFTTNGTYSYKWHSWGNGTNHFYNVSGIQIYEVLSDMIIPDITIISPSNITYTASRLDFNISSNENLSYCSVTLNNWITNNTMTINSSKTGANYTNSSIGDGGYQAKFWCNDTNNNINNTKTISFSIDTIPPSLSIIYPANTTYSINVSNLNYTSNGVSCWYSRNSGTANSSRVACGTNFTGVTSIEGSNTWTLYANDSVGNINSTSVTFFKDTIKPSILLISPNDGTQDTDGELSFIYNATDAGTISNCSLITDNNIYTTITSITKGINNVIDIIGISQNNELYKDDLAWNIRCTDSSNNLGNSETRHIDTKSNTPTGGGGGGGTSSFLGNPKDVILYYPEDWLIGENVNLTMKVYNNNNKLYNPKNITFKFEREGINLIDYLVGNNSEISNIFEVTDKSIVGKQKLSISIIDERTLKRDIFFNVKNNQRTIIGGVQQENNSIEDTEDKSNMLLWIGFGIIGFLIFLTIVTAMLVDKSKTRVLESRIE